MGGMGMGMNAPPGMGAQPPAGPPPMHLQQQQQQQQMLLRPPPPFHGGAPPPPLSALLGSLLSQGVLSATGGGGGGGAGIGGIMGGMMGEPPRCVPHARRCGRRVGVGIPSTFSVATFLFGTSTAGVAALLGLSSCRPDALASAAHPPPPTTNALSPGENAQLISLRSPTDGHDDTAGLSDSA